MQIYYAVVHQDGDSAFGISFPDLEGCFSAADSEGEIISQAQEALALYFEEASSLPRPSTIAKLRQNGEVAEDLAAGAFLIAVPFIQSSRKSRYNVVLDTSLVEGIDKAADAAGVSRSEFIARAASRSLEASLGAVVRGGRHLGAGKDAKTAAASALTQSKSKETTSAKAVTAAAKVMKDPKASKDAKSAASALTQKAKKK